MHGVAVFQHYKVGYVNKIIDGTYAACLQSFSHPARRRSDLYILYNCRHITGAELGVLNVNADVITGAAVNTLELRLPDVQRQVESRGSFLRETEHGKAVGTVVCNLELNCGIVEPECVMNILADEHLIEIRVVVQDKNTLVAGVRNIGLIKVKLLIRTHHAFAGNSAELTLLDLHVGHVLVVVAGSVIERSRNKRTNEHVLRRSNDLHRRFLSYVDLANPECVSVGVLFHSNALADYNVCDVGALLCPGLDLASAHGHAVAEFLYRHIGFNVVVKPLH